MTALAEFAERKLLPVEYLERRQVTDDAGGGIRFDYGPNARSRIRKAAASAHPTYWLRGDARPMRAFGSELAPKFATQADRTLFICEGESDALSLWRNHRLAMGIPGATMCNVLTREDVIWANRIIAIREPGDAGGKFVESVAKRLREVGFIGEILEISLDPHKDASALHIAMEGDRDRFGAALNAAIALAKPVAIPIVEKAQQTGALTFDDLARRCGEQVDWFVDGLIRRSGVLLMASQPKVGKSDTARNLAKAVATGSAFLGRRCQKGKVLWIGLEEPDSHLRERLEVMEMQALDVIYVVERPLEDESAWLRSMILRYKPDVAIIDTIGRFSNVENINDYSQVKRATQPILDMRTQFGTTFVLLHHNNRGNTVLGSVMWEGMVDTIMTITRNEDGTRFTQSRQRSGIDMEPTALTMDHDTGAITCVEPKFVTDRRVAEQRILRYLEMLARPAPREELARHGGRSASVGRAAVDSLLTADLIRSTGDGTKNSPRLYSPVPSLNSSNSSGRERGSYIDEEPDESEESARPIPDVCPMQPAEPDESDESEEPDGALLGYAREVLGE